MFKNRTNNTTHRAQQRLAEMARDMHPTPDPDRIWQQTVQDLGTDLAASRCIIYSYQEASRPLTVVAEYRQPELPSMLGAQVRLGECPDLSRAIATLETAIVERSLGKEGMESQSMAIVPIAYQERPLGAIVVHQCDRAKQWSAAQIEWVQQVAEQTGNAIAYANLYRELEEARHQAREATRLKRDFLAKISHEFRTPLNHIIGFLQLILDDMVDDTEEQREFIHEAQHSALDFLKLINDVLDFNKPKSSREGRESREPIQLSKVFKDVERCARQQIESKKLELNRSAPENQEDEILVYANYRQLLQVMLSVVGNAIKFTEGGVITISYEAIAPLKVRDRECPGMVEIRVSDTGIGVPLEYQSRLFEPFFRVHDAYTTPYPGTGLGLSLSKKIVEGMGGEIHFYSMGEGLGSTVTFTVPLYSKPTISRASIDAIAALDRDALGLAGEYRQALT